MSKNQTKEKKRVLERFTSGWDSCSGADKMPGVSKDISQRGTVKTPEVPGPKIGNIQAPNVQGPNNGGRGRVSPNVKDVAKKKMATVDSI
jgi:hypothetical protein